MSSAKLRPPKAKSRPHSRSASNTTEPPLLLNNQRNDAQVLEDYELVDNLYKSPASPGVVDRYRHKQTGDEVVVKRILKKQLFSHAQSASAIREVEIHSTLSHPNIVNCFHSGETEDCYFLVLEFIQDFDYFRLRVEEQNKPFCLKKDGAQDKLKALTFDLLNALQYLHSNGVVHLDLKPANLLLDRNVPEDEYPKLKLCDFGLSRRLSVNGSVNIEKRCGTEAYIAPEVRDHCCVTAAADMWSFGLLLFQLAVGFLPAALKWRPGEPLNFVPRYWRKYEGSGLMELIEACLKADPTQRISAADALTHRWFAHKP